MLFSRARPKTSHYRMAHVIFPRCPFKVTYFIVKLISILMVNIVLSVYTIQKMFSHKAMNHAPNLNAILHKRDCVVTLGFAATHVASHAQFFSRFTANDITVWVDEVTGEIFDRLFHYTTVHVEPEGIVTVAPESIEIGPNVPELLAVGIV